MSTITSQSIWIEQNDRTAIDQGWGDPLASRIDAAIAQASREVEVLTVRITPVARSEGATQGLIVTVVSEVSEAQSAS